MYAILETGGKQYRVSEGDTIKIENISGVTEGAVTFDNILMVSDGDKASFGSYRMEKAIGKMTDILPAMVVIPIPAFWEDLPTTKNITMNKTAQIIVGHDR